MKFGWTQENETLHGRICMIALPIMAIVYFTSGQLLPGIW